jgi:hypothetical protein
LLNFAIGTAQLIPTRDLLDFTPEAKMFLSIMVWFWMLRCHWKSRNMEIFLRSSAYYSFACGTVCYLHTRFLHEKRKEIKVYHALRKGLPQFSKDFLEFQKEPEELDGFAKLVSYLIFRCKDEFFKRIYL